MKGTVTISLEDYNTLRDYQNNLLKKKEEEWLEYFSPLNKKKIYISKCQAIENIVLENNLLVEQLEKLNLDNNELRVKNITLKARKLK